MIKFGKLAIAALLASTALNAAAHAKDVFKHVLLISVDGMHEVDLQRYVKGHPSSTFAYLVKHGLN